MPDNRISITIPVKPYVKQWFSSKFGNPPRFPKGSGDHEFLVSLLSKTGDAHPLCTKQHPCELTIYISWHAFEHSGHVISQQNISRFRKHYETRIKFEMYLFISTREAFGVKLKDAIFDFQNCYGYTEDTWNYEAIKKDYYRNACRKKIDFAAIEESLLRMVKDNPKNTGV